MSAESRRQMLERIADITKQDYYAITNNPDFFVELTPEDLETFNKAYQRKEVASWAMVNSVKGGYGGIKKILETL